MNITKITNRITAMRDLFADGEIDGGEVIEYMNDLLIDIKDASSDFTFLNDNDDSYYETFEKTDFTNLSVDE